MKPRTSVTKSSATAEIARDAKTVIQCHSRSFDIVPIDAAQMNFYQHSIVI